MGNEAQGKQAQRTLFDALRRIFFLSLVIVLCGGWIAFATVGFISMRAQLRTNMTIIARTTAYSVEAAVMFGDRLTATEILNTIAHREHLCSATIQTPDGANFAHAERGCNPLRAMFQEQAREDIQSGNRVLGTVELLDDGAAFTDFIRRGLFVLLSCLLLVTIMAFQLARYLERRLSAQLTKLASAARTSRLEGDFSRRLPTFEIVEFDELGRDFNALFGEIQARNTELTLRQSQLEIINSTLSRMAMSDSLTGLSNRACFSEQLKSSIEMAQATGTRIGVLYIDNDRFKAINDNYGHAAGDNLLIDVAHRLRGSVRESDLVARLGGDEFAILLAPVYGPDDLIRVADKILSVMRRKLRLVDRVNIELGVSIGMAIFPDHGANAAELLSAADHAMYRAKRLGRGCACMYDPDLDSTVEDT
ncbi:MAG: diguanylate cyclase [Azoarcus sp.]|jgi:diguanylate cyclase (GGDEF)-like protein|nr:diguanylate cyclase [Azoarcus sp.]